MPSSNRTPQPGDRDLSRHDLNGYRHGPLRVKIEKGQKFSNAVCTCTVYSPRGKALYAETKAAFKYKRTEKRARALARAEMAYELASRGCLRKP